MPSQTESEFAEFDGKNSWNEVYQRLKNEASLATLGDSFSTKFARDPDNRRKNRYRDVSPYDHSRVKLSGAENDYINASFIEVPEANRKYILTQGPLEHTMDDFWQMVWEQESRAIVMLNRVVEKGALKCSQYWPLGADYGYDQDMYFPDSCLRVTLTTEQDFQHFTIRTLELEKMESGDKREVLHFHYTTWPDFGVPSSPNAFLHFLHSVRETGSLEADVGPAIIHCSAGIGRSGTFCLVDSCLVEVENNGTLKHIDVRKSLIRMRTYRMGLIQTSDQLRFSYLAIIEGAHAILAGGGLGSVRLSSVSLNQSQNHTGSLSSQVPGKISNPHPARNGHTDDLTLLHLTTEEPPPIPPKKSPILRQCGVNGWGEEEDSETEDEKFIYDKNDDGDDEEFDTLIDKTEEDSLDGSSIDSDEEIRAADDMKHQIREERKKQTLEQIDQMKERQKKSERYRAKPYSRSAMYVGLAVVVGVAAVAIYKYLV